MTSAAARAVSAALGLLIGGAAAFAAAPGPADRGESPRIHLGEAVPLGNGTARTLVAEDDSGKPAVVAVVMTEEALDGLPPEDSDDRPAAVAELPMPTEGPDTGYDHATVNWNPRGRIPQGVSTAARFDIHFYLIGAAERQAITFKGGRAAEAARTPATDLVPPGYVVPRDMAVERIGLLGVDPTEPEFQGKPFRTTFIYGYYNGQTVFLEPTVAASLLERKRNLTLKVRRPAAYSHPAYYPDRYRIAYDPTGRTYVVALSGLKPWKME